MKKFVIQMLTLLCSEIKDKVKLSQTLKNIAVYVQAIIDAGDKALGADVIVPSTGNTYLDAILTGLPIVVSMFGDKVLANEELKGILDFIASIVNTVVEGLGITAALEQTVAAANEMEHTITASPINAPVKEKLLATNAVLQKALSEHVAEVMAKAKPVTIKA